MIETKDFALKLKAGIEEGGKFTAYAAQYNVEDLQGDILKTGSFKRAIQQEPAGGYPLLWSHRQDSPIGLVSLSDSEFGPVASGTIDRQDPEGEVAYQRAKKGIVRGVSIGFTIPNPDAIEWKGSTRHISEIRLHELSLVAIPAQPGAQILTVKSLGDAARVLDGFQVESLGAAELAALQTIQKHLNRLLAGREEPAPDAAILRDLKDLAKLVRAA